MVCPLYPFNQHFFTSGDKSGTFPRTEDLKNWKGVLPGCSLVQLEWWKKSLSCVWLFVTLWTGARLLCPWDFPGNSTGVGCHCLLQMKVKVSHSCLTLWHPMNYTIHGILQVRILEWIAFPFSRGSSLPRDWTQVSHIAGRFFTSWATREAPIWSRPWFFW